MKKIISILLVLVLCIGIFAGCNSTNEGLENAKTLLFNQYNTAGKGEENKIISNTELTNVIISGGETYEVSWALEITKGAAGGVVLAASETANFTTLKLVDQSEELHYVLTATVKAPNGDTGTVTINCWSPQVVEQEIPKEFFIYNPNDKVYVTGEEYLYADKNKYELNLSADSAKALKLSLRENTDGSVTFITADNKYLYCDGTNVQLVAEEGDYTIFELKAVENGYYIKSINGVYETKQQYLEIYSGYLTCFGLSDTSNVKLYTFSLVEAVVCDHKSVEVAAKDATCTEAGNTAGHVCSKCGVTLDGNETVKALGHDWGEWEIITEATADQKGTRKHTCKREGCGVTEEVEYELVLTEWVVVDAPEVGVAYKWGFNNGATYYFNGKDRSDSNLPWYLTSSTAVADGANVYLEAVEGVENGYRLYFLNGETKTYVRSYQRTGVDYVAATLELTKEVPTEYYTYSAEYKTLIFTLADGDTQKNFFLCANGTYTTIGTQSDSNIEKEGYYPTHFYEEKEVKGEDETPDTGWHPVTSTPEDGVAYKFGLWQNTLGNTYYATGEMNSYYLATTTDVAKAADLYVVAVDGGYKLYLKAGETVKYINVYEYEKEGKTKVSQQLVDTADDACVFVWNEELSIFTAQLANDTYYLGTYDYTKDGTTTSYYTISASKISYITGDNASKIGVSQFPAHLYIEVNAGGDNKGDDNGDEVTIPTEEGKVTLYFTLKSDSVAIPTWACPYISGGAWGWADWCAKGSETFKHLEGTDIWYLITDKVNESGTYKIFLNYTVMQNHAWKNVSTNSNPKDGDGNCSFTYVAGEQLIDLGEHGFTAELADPTTLNFVLVGSFNGWNNDKGIALSATATAGIYESEYLDVPADTAFKITSGDWASNGAVEIANNGGDFKVETAGKYKVRFDLNKGEVTLVEYVKVPETPTEIIDAAEALEVGTTMEGEYSLTGVITVINYAYDSNWGNITVTIKVTGDEKNREFYCFRIKGEGADTLAVGDTITVTGTITNYNGTIEFNAGAALSNIVKGEGTGDDENDESAYVKVTEDQEDWSGTYLLVWEEKNQAFNSSYANLNVSEANGTAVEIVDGKIVATDAMNAICVIIEKVEGGYTLKTADGRYLSKSTDLTGFDIATSAEEAGIVSIAWENDAPKMTGAGGAVFCVDTHKAHDRFVFYATKYVEDDGAMVAFYKLNAEVAGGDGETEETPDTGDELGLPGKLTFTDIAKGDSSNTYMSENYAGWTVTGTLGQAYKGYLGFGKSGSSESAIMSPNFKVTEAFTIAAVIKGNGSNNVMTSTLTFTLVDADGKLVATGYAEGEDNAAFVPANGQDTTYTISFTFEDGKTWTDVSNLLISFAKATGNIGLKSLDFVQ